MTITDLEQASRPVPREQGVFEVVIPEGWQQGRGAFGGLTIASLARSIQLFADTPDRPLRSLTAQLPGPTLVGPAEIRVEAMRISSGQSTLAARLTQQGEVRALAVAVLAHPRAVGADEFCELARPAVRPWREMTPISPPPGAAAFTQHFEYRSDGPFPFTSAKEARAEGWIRARTSGAMPHDAHLAALIDVWWPASFVRAAAPRPIGTVAFTMQVVRSASPVDPAVPLAYRGRVWVQSEGWIVEQRELWDEDGRLIALNQQTIAVIK
ncbi:MAG TPA: thioesterase family protein [Polyangiaceae bacterium]|jgi:hypothetical protein